MTATPTRQVGARGVMAEQCRVRSPRGVVAAAAPLAARVGAAMLSADGNAFDAAVAAALAETVLLPPKCGLGGDLVALVWEADVDAPVALLAIGGAPAGLAAVAARGDLAETGPMSVGVPGAPAGYLELARRGRLDLGTLAAPAISAAREGFCWSAICTLLSEESVDLVAKFQPEGTTYFPDGDPIKPGAVVRLTGLARVLEHFVDERDQFLSGAVGAAVIERVQGAGGVLTMADLCTASAEWASASARRFGDWSVFATPAPTHGDSLLDAVSRLEDDLSPAAVYGAVADAVARRKLSLADPSGTSMVSAVDADGTMVTIVHSHSYPRFGSGLIVDDYDLILANRAGRGFIAEEGHPNFPVAGRRPATTLHAWGLRSNAGTRLQGATPGGANQMPWNAQSIARILSASDPVGAIGDAVVGPRWQFDSDGGMTVEDGFDASDRDDLRRLVDPVRMVDTWGLRSAMQIVADENGVFTAVADPRTGGAALPM